MRAIRESNKTKWAIICFLGFCSKGKYHRPSRWARAIGRKVALCKSKRAIYVGNFQQDFTINGQTKFQTRDPGNTNKLKIKKAAETGDWVK